MKSSLKTLTYPCLLTTYDEVKFRLQHRHLPATAVFWVDRPDLHLLSPLVYLSKDAGVHCHIKSMLPDPTELAKELNLSLYQISHVILSYILDPVPANEWGVEHTRDFPETHAAQALAKMKHYGTIVPTLSHIALLLAQAKFNPTTDQCKDIYELITTIVTKEVVGEEREWQ